VRSWQQTGVFDHDVTDFKLQGAHRAVRCTECHRPANMGLSVRQVVFQNAAKECAGCHEDIHESQFVKEGKTDCEACHSQMVWKPSRFDHELQSKFSLAGSHKAVPCASCHVQMQNVNGRETKLYRLAPSQCSACHSNLVN
jgi:predicted CXXCH cytochrome family protein